MERFREYALNASIKKEIKQRRCQSEEIYRYDEIWCHNMAVETCFNIFFFIQHSTIKKNIKVHSVERKAQWSIYIQVSYVLDGWCHMYVCIPCCWAGSHRNRFFSTVVLENTTFCFAFYNLLTLFKYWSLSEIEDKRSSRVISE